jgi:hypothetical protein
VVTQRYEGTPQGGPLSPLLANVPLDEVDRALEKRGHRFVRYADDCNVYVRSVRAGERVLAGLRKLYERLHLKVNDAKTAVAPASRRKFLGDAFWYGPGGQLKHWRRGATMYRELKAMDAADEDARKEAGNSRCWWRNSRMRLNRAMPIAYFDRLGVPRLS